MSLMQWPALARYAYAQKTLVYQRAIYGKVTGQRSDYRWIGRTPGFEGHRWDIQRRLSIGLEDEPRQAFLWHVDREHGRCYAVACYPSSARDASDRSGFLEKQILEFTLRDPGETALAALVLLKEAAAKDSSEWTSHADDQRWRDANFCLPLKDTRKEVSDAAVEVAIETGLNDLGQLDDEALRGFYLGLIRRSTGFLRVQKPLSPEALAVLLLPLREEQAMETSLAGGLPARVVDAAELRTVWSGVAYQQGQVRDVAVSAGTPGENALAGMMAEAIREKAHPRTAPLLEFAISAERWSGPLQAVKIVPTEFEKKTVQSAVGIVSSEMRDDPLRGGDERVGDARRRHLRAKQAVILANAAEAFALHADVDAETAELISDVRKSWNKA